MLESYVLNTEIGEAVAGLRVPRRTRRQRAHGRDTQEPSAGDSHGPLETSGETEWTLSPLIESRFQRGRFLLLRFGNFVANNCGTGGGLLKSFDGNPNTIIQGMTYEFKALTNL